MTLAKALAVGMPIGALLAKDEVASSFSPGTHASTFGGNLLSTAAGVATLEVLLEDGFLENCRKQGEYFHAQLVALKEKHPSIIQIKGKGLILGIELAFQGADIASECMKRGILINCTMETILRFIPPLIITENNSPPGPLDLSPSLHRYLLLRHLVDKAVKKASECKARGG